MNQINQMNMLNQYNQMNQMNLMNLMILNYNINQMNNMNLMNQMDQMLKNDPMNLTNKISQIIQRNPILTNEKKEILSQLYQLYQNMNWVNQIFGVGEFQDCYPNNKELKKYIYFIRNIDDQRIGVKIPFSLKSEELYQAAENYKLYKYSDLKLFYKNNYLKEDKTPIGLIIDGEEINIVEELDDIDFTYQSYLSKNANNKKINIIFSFTDGFKRSMIFNSTLGILFYNKDNQIILLNKPYNLNNLIFKGKIIKVKIYNKEKLILNWKIGTLNTIEELCNYIENHLSNCRNIQKLKIGGQELEKDDKRIFLSIGISNNFICNIDLINRTE